MSQDVKIPSALQNRLNTIAELAEDLSDQQSKLVSQFQDALDELKAAFESAEGEQADDDEYMSARELFTEDPLYDEMYDIASTLGGQLGGDGGDTFEFWIPSTC
jgi:glutamine synthetase type III